MTDPIDLMSQWWEYYQPDDRADYAHILSGMRQLVPTGNVDTFVGGKEEKIVNYQRQTASCQYWVKGLSAVCTNWDSASLKCTVSEPPHPSGYGIDGCCDRLGRRSWCSAYMPIGEDDLNQFVCIAPCIEKSGLGRQVVTETRTLLYRPLNPDEIKGYNPDEKGVGRCDGWGMGRGDKGPFKRIEDIYNVMPVCRHYRPQQMGFGAIQPRPYHGSDKPGKPFDPKVNWIPTEERTLYNGSKADPLTKMDVRLPFVFQMYNSMAMYQKCAHWGGTNPAFFEVDYIGSDPSMFCIQMKGESLCECKDSGCNDYKNIKEKWTEGLPWILTNVWAPYGGIVCNGAKPECPCYSGKWIYCIDNRMRDGMSITADQIFELRFWTSDWASQDEYDAFYLKKPGVTRNESADESTADIYTFTRWKEEAGVFDPNERVMLGKKHHMCMPAPLNRREFDVGMFITKSDYDYPKLNTNTGTNVKGGKVSFPTLARELEDPSNYIPDVFIAYPYFTIDPWSLPPCKDDKGVPKFCYHDSNLMEDPLISVIGKSVLRKTIYVINRTLYTGELTEAFDYMDKYIRAGQIPNTKWRDFCESATRLISDLTKEGTAIFYSSSDDFGFFEVQRVKLKINDMNNLYVLCEYETGDFSRFGFRKRSVQSRYWAGLIEQNYATHKHDGDTWWNEFPLWFHPGFQVAGYVHTTLGEVQTVFSTYALYVYSLLQDVAYYSYCINEYSETDSNVQKWTQVGATGYIWAEIDNVEISYLWPFAVTKASIKYNLPEDSENKEIFMCSSNVSDIPLEVVYPETLLSPGISIDRNAQIIRRSIPPNAVLLKAPEPLPFFNKDWTLSIEYVYQRIDTFMGEKVVWPVAMGSELALNQFAQSPFRVEHNPRERNFVINDVGNLTTRGSIKIMAYIVDDKNRVQAAVSTKMLLQGYNGACRSVDINYKYSVDALGFDLEPAYGFFTWRGSPRVKSNTAPISNTGVSEGDGSGGVGPLVEPIVHARTAKCGDHECQGDNCIGPMWFPFNACTTFDYYDEINGAAGCTMMISEAAPNLEVMGYGGWRYVVANEYNSWVTTGGNWASSCGTAWYYHYSKAGDMQRFVGFAKKKAKVDKWYYIFMKWALPPFGNYGRGLVERFITRDFASFIDMSGGDPHTSYEYMPMVFDKEDLFADLNPFANPDEATPLHEPFSHFSMLSNYTASFIGETVSKTRHRFEEIIEPIHHGNCMYPHPLMEGFAGMYRVIRYGFKSNTHVWAWPEWWKPIERNKKSSLGQFKFLDIARPEYYFDYNKAEHRLITDEGKHILIFEPPKISETKEGSDDANANIFPSISIDGEFPRYFKLLYDDYSTENVEWKDEATTGEEGASGGGNIYEAANNGAGLNGLYTYTEGTQWLHDYNTLFDANSAAEPNEDRKAYLGKNVFTGEDVYLYYNRGLIASITRNRLKYLPISLSVIGPPDVRTDTRDKNTDSFSYCWRKKSPCPLTVKVSGYWGVGPVLSDDGTETKVIYSMPGIRVYEGYGLAIWEDETGFPLIPEEAKLVDTINPRSGRDISITSVTNYDMVFELPRTPDRVIKNVDYFFVLLSATPGEIIKVTNIEVEVGSYVRAEEEINVWERRYYVGEATLPEKNADGADTDLYRTYDRDMKNAGQYFPFEDRFATTHSDHEDGTFLDEDVTDFEEGGKVLSKLNMVGFTKIFREDEWLTVTMDNLKEIELVPQQELYLEAFEQDAHDKLEFNGIVHPAVGDWLTSINIPIMRANGMALTYNKVDWEHNAIKLLLNQEGEFISPGGHYFAWGDDFKRTRCYYFGGIMNVYVVKYVHNRHGRGGEGVSEDTWTPGWAYAGWGRLEYYEGMDAVVRGLGQTEANMGIATDSLTGAKNNTPKRS